MKSKFYHLSVISTSGRVFSEKVKYEFIEDKSRIINSKSFRRLEYKTQVFINYIGDHYRTRLTHSLEVSQIALYIAKELGLNTDLTEAIALAHDIGHPPFGHAGEQSLNDASHLYSGFDHNLQTIRILSKLENNSPYYNGLNLTLDTIDGILKHNGPISDITKINQYEKILSDKIMDYSSQSSLESQVASLSDDIGYVKHDIDDGVRANFIDIYDLIELDLFVPFKNQIRYQFSKTYNEKYVKIILDQLTKFLINDLLYQTSKNIIENKIQSTEDVREYKKFLVGFTKETENLFLKLKEFLFQHVYRNKIVNRINQKTRKIIKDLFEYYLSHPMCLPESCQPHYGTQYNKQQLSETVIDYIAGMTDRYAVEEHRKLYDLYYY